MPSQVGVHTTLKQHRHVGAAGFYPPAAIDSPRISQTASAMKTAIQQLAAISSNPASKQVVLLALVRSSHVCQITSMLIGNGLVEQKHAGLTRLEGNAYVTCFHLTVDDLV